MPIDLIAAAFDLIVGQSIDLAKDKAKQSERILKVLNAIGLKQDSPRADDFDSLYAYTLVAYGIDKPKPILEFFRHQLIKRAFRQSFETRDPSYLEEESENFLDWSPVAKELLSTMDYDPRAEFAEFKTQFITAARLTRSVHEVLIDHTLEDIQTGINERLTTENFNKKLQPIIKGIEQFSSKKKELDGQQLKSIASESLDHHRERFAFNLTDEKKGEIPREAHINIIESLSSSTKPIIGINGPSGIGKSTLLRQIGRDINNNGQGIALWIPAENIESAISIEELILNVLYKYDANLSNEAGFDTLEIASNTNIGLVLLVDDINRVSSPNQVLAALSALCTNAASKNALIHFLVPLWPGQIATSPDSRTTEKYWEIIGLGYFSEAEGQQYSQLIYPTRTSYLIQLISSLGRDPFLIGLAVENLEKLSTDDSLELLRQIFTHTIEASIIDAREVSNELATPKEFNTAIDSLVELILEEGTPEPNWECIRKYLGTGKSNLIFALARVNRLGWIDLINGEEIWRWKHSRLRDVLIGRWLANNILQPTSTNSPSIDIGTVLSDPGLAEAFALAFVFLPKVNQKEALDVLCKHQHLALVEILRLNLFSRNNEFNTTVAQTLKQTLLRVGTHQNELVVSPESIIRYKLSEITNPAILDVTDGQPKSWYWGIARFRNGDLSSGIYAVANHARNYEFLMGHFPFLEQAISDFGQLNNGKRLDVVTELVKFLSNSGLENAVLYLAIILKWAELLEPLWDTWINLNQDSRQQSLAAMICFLSQYEDPSIAPKLKNAFLMSLKISDMPKPEGMRRERSLIFIEPLRLALSRSISHAAAAAWAKIIPENQELSKSVGYLLGGIDYPETLDAYIHLKQKGFTIWHEMSESIDPMAEGFRDENRIKNEGTRNCLWDRVMQETDLSIRIRAFGFWRMSARSTDIPKLQSILMNDPIFEEATKLRIRLRDKSATTLLIDRINKDPGNWCRFAPLLSSEPGVFEALLANLENIPSEQGLYETESIFYRLPLEQVKKIVLAKEQLLLDSYETWPALWLSNEDNALKLVVKAIKRVKQEEKGKIEYFFSSLLGMPSTITQKMLDFLTPILGYFPKDSLKWLAEMALRNGLEKWAIKNLDEVLKNTEWEDFKWVYLENIISTLSDASQYVQDGFDAVLKNSRLFGLENSYESRHKYTYVSSPVDAVKIWLLNALNPNQFTISARIVSRFGSSDDIEWWLSQKPVDDTLISLWDHALFCLRRRRWQTTEV